MTPAETIARLRTVAAMLNDSRDKVSADLREVERFLVDLSIGIEVSVPLPNGTSCLAFARVGGTWGLYIDRATSLGGSGFIGLGSSSSTERVGAALVVGDLIDALLAAATEHVAALRNAESILVTALSRPAQPRNGETA